MGIGSGENGEGLQRLLVQVAQFRDHKQVVDGLCSPDAVLVALAVLSLVDAVNELRDATESVAEEVSRPVEVLDLHNAGRGL